MANIDKNIKDNINKDIFPKHTADSAKRELERRLNGKPFSRKDYDYARKISSQKKSNQKQIESKIMRKKLIRLTESDLHQIVKESVNKILKEAVNELDPRAYASARDIQNQRDAEYDRQMADYNKKNPLSRMMSKKPEMPRGYGRGKKFNDAAVDAFNRDYGHDWSNPNSTKHQTMGKGGNVTQYSQLGDSTFTTDYDFDARQAKAGVEPTGRERGVVTSGGWNNKTHQNFAPTKRGMTYSDADYTLRGGASKPSFFDKGIKVADQMANGTGKYNNGKWQ